MNNHFARPGGHEGKEVVLMSIKEKLKLIEESERRNSRNIYPGLREAERQRSAITAKEESDWRGGAPNYGKFEGWTPEEALVWLNID